MSVVFHVATFNLIKHENKAKYDNKNASLFVSYSFITGVNSFQVYMAYKDYYQMSNSEVQ